MKGGVRCAIKIIINNRTIINLNQNHYIEIEVDSDIKKVIDKDTKKTYKTLNSTKKEELKIIINPFVINRIRKTEFNINNIIVNEQQSTIDVYVS